MKTLVTMAALLAGVANAAIAAISTNAFAADSITAPKLIGPTESCVPNEMFARQEIEIKREIHVIVCYNVGADGKPQTITIANPPVSEHIDRAARRCTERITYEPGTKNGEPMLFPLIMQYNWCAQNFSAHKRACKPIPITAEMRAMCAKALGHQN